MGSFHTVCPRYRWTLTPTAPTTNRQWETFEIWQVFLSWSVDLHICIVCLAPDQVMFSFDMRQSVLQIAPA